MRFRQLVMFLLSCTTLIATGPALGATPSGTVVINDNAVSTSSSLVTLTINAKDGTTNCPLFYPSICGTVYMRLSSGGSTWSDWQSARTSVSWLLRGNQVCAQFVDGHGFPGPISCDTIQVVNDSVSLSFSDGRSYFTKIADACSNVVSGQEISLKTGSFTEDVTLAGTIDVNLVGGYDSNYGLADGTTTLTGNLQLAGESTVSLTNMEIAGTVTVSSGTLSASYVTIS